MLVRRSCLYNTLRNCSGSGKVQVTKTPCCCKPPPKPKPCCAELMKIGCKSVLVLGGSGSIGIAVASELLGAGAKHVTISGLNECQGREAARRLESAHGTGRACFFRCDVRCAAQTERALQRVRHLDICINCVRARNGIDWEGELETNVMGSVRGTLLAQGIMSRCNQGNGGCIVHLCGTCGVEPLEAAPVQSAGRHAVVGLCRSLGGREQEIRTGVRVIALCPGITSDLPGKAIEEESRAAAPGYKHLLEQHIRAAKAQRPVSVGKAAAYLIRYAPSGTVWVVEGGQLFELQMPSRRNCSKLICTYI